jgi:hypothetical protein
MSAVASTPFVSTSRMRSASAQEKYANAGPPTAAISSNQRTLSINHASMPSLTIDAPPGTRAINQWTTTN